MIESKNNLEIALRTKTQKFGELKKGKTCYNYLVIACCFTLISISAQLLLLLHLEWDTERDNLQNKANKHKVDVIVFWG